MAFNNQEVVETDPEDLIDCVDNTMYAVLHCQTTYFKYRFLQGQFIRKFSMLDSGEMYILPASCIRGPVIFVPDIEDEGNVSLEDYMAVLPRHKMGTHFIYHMMITWESWKVIMYQIIERMRRTMEILGR
jgi:hypothetical protein